MLIEDEFPAVAGGLEPTNEQKKEMADLRLKDLKAKKYLFQAIDRSILETILNTNTSKDIWDSMKLKYQGNARVKRTQFQALRREFEVFYMKDGESVDSYFTRTLTIINKMRAHGEKMADITVIEKIMRSISSKFN